MVEYRKWQVMSETAAGREGARRHRGNEGQAMKKMRIMVLALMVMSMAAGLLSGPAAAYAEGSTPEIALGAGEIAKATSTARNYTVWFGRYNDIDYGNGPIQWRVLSGGGSADPDDDANLPVSGMGEALLISKQILDVNCYFKQDCSSNQWAGSDAQAWCTAFWNSSNWLTAAEKRAVNATTVNEQNDQFEGGIQYFYRGGHNNDLYSAAPLNGEHIFFLSAREADQLFAGDDDRKAERPYLGQSYWWWLRSPSTYYDDYSGYVNDFGWVNDKYVAYDNGPRPAFNLNLSSVLFSSLIQSNQYKLTLADSNRTIGIQPGAAITRDSATQITVPYTKDSGSNHVSLLITNKNDSWAAGSGWSTGAVKQYYATAAVSEANGTVTFTLPDNYETNKGNWQVWLLAEQVNGEHETDYGSAPTAITVPNWIPAEKVTLSPSSAALVVGGDAVKLTASVSPNNATDKKVKWSVTGTGVALYSNEACSTALDLNTAISTTEVYAKGTAAGNTTVTVTSNADSSKQASCSVTVKGIATVTTLPTAKSWVDNGNAQALVTAGAAVNGTMQYVIGTETAPGTNWSDAIPTEKDIGKYYVWHKAQGDATHLDSEPKPVSAGITPKAATVTALEQTVKEGESIQTGKEWATLTEALSGHTLNAVTLTAENGKIVPSAAKILDAKGNDVTGNYTLSYQPAALTTLGKISSTVTFTVVNGSWDDGTNADKTATLTGFAGDTLKLAAADIPAVGAKPGGAFKAGVWDVVPSTETEITADKTYTYTYALRDAYLVTVTNDGNGTASASPNSGYEGTEVLLTATPAQGYKFKEWQVVSGGVTITDNKFNIGKANVVVKAVFEAQATGWHKGEAKILPGAPVIQCSNMQEVVESIIAAIQKGEMKGISEEVRQAVLRPDAQVLVLFISAPLSVDQIPAEDRAALEQLQKDAGYTGIVPFDITLMLNVNGQDVAEVHETKIPVKFSVGIMENLLGTPRTFALVNVHNNAAKVLPTTRRGNFLDGESTEFSTYAIAYKDEETPTDTPAPTSTPAPVIDPAKFDDVAVPSDSFTFKKVWQGDSEKSIDFTLYRQDGTVYHHGFDKKVDSNREWRYNAWFSEPAACYVIEKPIPGYQTKYVNVGVYEHVTDRCCDGGTIINKKIPKTGDEANPVLWAGMMLAGIAGLTATIVVTRKRGKAGK